MFENFFKIATRNLFRRKAFSIINISGLAIGMASAILILLWVQNEMSYDHFHENKDRLYQVWSNNVVSGQIESGVHTPEIMAPVLKNDVPEIDQVARISWTDNYLLSFGDKDVKSLKAKCNVVDPEFLTMFSFPLTKGNPHTALNDPYSIVITEQLAKKIFGNEDPLGKVVKIENDLDCKVTGVLKDLPNNTQFDFEFLMSYELNNVKGYIDSDWTDVSIQTYVMLKPNSSPATANEKIKNLIIKHSGNRAKTTQFLYPLSQLRLYSNFKNGQPSGGLIERVRVFTIIAALILLIACINFMNLSTARSEKRAREVGIRKVIGARKNSLIGHFLAESVFLAFISGLLALLIVQLCLPAFNTLVQKQLSLEFGNIYFWMAAIGFILLTGTLAGSYPAFFLSAFKPVIVLKGTFKNVGSLVTPRKVLVVLQFTFAISLIICTIIIEQQVKYAQSRETGYNRNNLGYIFMEGSIPKNYELIKDELINSGAVISLSRTQAPLTQNWSVGISMNWAGKDPNTRIQINRYVEDGDLVKTAGMQLVEGRDIDVKTYPTDSTACLISEAAVKAMGFKNPIGQLIFDDPIQWHVVGVIKDFVLESPFEVVKPFMIKGPRYRGNTLHLKLNEANSISQNLAKMETIFRKYNPAYPFDFHFIDREYAQKFSDEQLTGTLATLFAALTILISCLGLFGLATYMAENRIKEIGVRKVLGASVINIAALLSKDFLKLVIIALLIASPLAWLTMNSWLKGYDYRVSMSAWVFIIAGSMAIFIALATVSYQALKAALANPVKSLRTE